MVEFLIEWGLFGCALLSIGTTIGIIVVLTIETAAFLKEVPIADFLFGGSRDIQESGTTVASGVGMNVFTVGLGVTFH